MISMLFYDHGKKIQIKVSGVAEINHKNDKAQEAWANTRSFSKNVISNRIKKITVFRCRFLVIKTYILNTSPKTFSFFWTLHTYITHQCLFNSSTTYMIRRRRGPQCTIYLYRFMLLSFISVVPNWNGNLARSRFWPYAYLII